MIKVFIGSTKKQFFLPLFIDLSLYSFIIAFIRFEKLSPTSVDNTRGAMCFGSV